MEQGQSKSVEPQSSNNRGSPDRQTANQVPLQNPTEWEIKFIQLLGETIRERMLQAEIDYEAPDNEDNPDQQTANQVPLQIPAEWKIEFKQLAFGKRLGQGLAGIVYEAKYGGEDVAVKRYHLKPMDVNSFVRDALLLSTISHPHIVEFRGLCPEPPFAIVMERVTGASLADILRSSAEISWAQRIQLANDLARALSYLHSRNIAHGNLQSTNVLVDHNMRAKLCECSMPCFRLYNAIAWNQKASWMAPELPALSVERGRCLCIRCGAVGTWGTTATIKSGNCQRNEKQGSVGANQQRYTSGYGVVD